jgi:hypothetical protein
MPRADFSRDHSSFLEQAKMRVYELSYRKESILSTHSDFDFLVGDWHVDNERLKNPLTGSGAWYRFEGTSKVRQLWGGVANLDEYVGNSPEGLIRGLTVRLFDPAANQWRIYWANGSEGLFGTPMIGSFTEGRGEFFDQEFFEQRSIFVRFVWTTQSRTTCRWEQAFSEDGARTWETNWIMTFTRSTA